MPGQQAVLSLVPCASRSQAGSTSARPPSSYAGSPYSHSQLCRGTRAMLYLSGSMASSSVVTTNLSRCMCTRSFVLETFPVPGATSSAHNPSHTLLVFFSLDMSIMSVVARLASTLALLVSCLEASFSSPFLTLIYIYFFQLCNTIQ